MWGFGAELEDTLELDVEDASKGVKGGESGESCAVAGISGSLVD